MPPACPQAGGMNLGGQAVLRSSLVIATLGGLVAAGAAALPAQADRIAGAGHRGGVNTARTARIPAALAAVSAARHQRGALTGVVVGVDGRPLAGACVTATGAAGSAMTMTRADGRYVLTGLRPGRYALRYTGCASAQRASSQAAPSLGFQAQSASTTAKPSVTVTGGVKILPTITLPLAGPRTAGDRARRAITPSASGTGQIRGVVTGNGHPVGGVCVEALPVRGGLVPTTRTSANGHYTVRKVLAGRYFVEFADSESFGCRNPGNWLSQWYKGVTTPFPTDKATVVRVATGKITRGINASMRRGGQISGTVRSKSGKPLSGICVTVIGRVTGGTTELQPRTGKLGRFVAHGLFKGSYVVGFSIGCGSSGNYAPQWWRHAATQRAATHLRIAGTRHVSGIDGALAPGSAITGVVHAGSLSGPPLRGICVDAFNPRTGVSADGRTNRNGDYKLIGLSAGTYFVEYQTGCGNRGNYLALERNVTVAKGQTKRGVDVALKPGAGLSGTVTNTHGKPIGGICVDISSGRASGFGDIETNPDGTYRATGLDPGTYTVQFSGGCDNSGSYATQYYNGKPTQETADPVKLTAGDITTGIDATMQPGATIAGTLTDAAGHRLSGVCIGIGSRFDQLEGDGGFTDIEVTANGSYRAQNLNPGVYVVNFGCGVGSLASEWFKSRRTGDSADLVSASGGQVTSGISAVMHPAGSITGTVTNRAGKPLNRICELAVPAGQPYPAVIVIGGPGQVTRNGNYHIGHLAAGRYDVQFFDCDGGRYGSQWYRAKRTQASATPVLVRQGRASPHIDAKLGVGGSISGRIVNHTGRPVRRFCVEAFDAAAESFGFVLTDRAGNYKIAGLSTGTYQIIAAKCFGGNEAYTTRPGNVHVHAPQALNGINVRLPAGGSITGTVLAGSPSAARSDVCVVIVPVKANGSFGLTASHPDGTYRVSGLAAGQYQVNFADPNCFFSPNDDLASQWFNQQQTQATADHVTVTAGTTTSGINATLLTNGSISGSVTDQAHAPVGGECVTAVPVGATPDPLLAVRQRPEIAVSGPNGSYSLILLPPGKYKVEFSVGCGDSGFRTQWWQNAGSAAAATVITVGAGAALTGIDAALKR
jgi:protocatechuate 3,4-dioxygenase beta subunit